jgi:hypothetical protein
VFLFFSNARTLIDSKIKNDFTYYFAKCGKLSQEFGPTFLENDTGLSPNTLQFTGIK